MHRREILFVVAALFSVSIEATAQPVSGECDGTPSCPLFGLGDDLAAVNGASGLCGTEPDPELEAKFRRGTLTADEFVDFIAPYAQASERETGIPASVTIAQAALETGWGKSARKAANNLFGIKGRGDAGSVKLWTREYVRGRWVRVRANFAAYSSFRESVLAHGRLISERPLYANAMRHTNDPEAFARARQRAGYATDPAYASKLMSIIRRRDLTRFDGTRECS